MFLIFFADDQKLERLGPPRIQSNSGQQIIPENSALELVCLGGFRLEWVTPYLVEKSRKVISPEPPCRTCEDLSTRHRSVLRIRQTTPSDTGLYQCVYRKYANRVENVTSTTVNVYVASQGKTHLYLSCLQKCNQKLGDPTTPFSGESPGFHVLSLY